MTKFTTLKNKTVFTHYVNLEIESEVGTPIEDWQSILHIGTDVFYGDVFKVWNTDENYFTIYFGTKGDEFQTVKNQMITQK
jgi:hypothetical protein